MINIDITYIRNPDNTWNAYVAHMPNVKVVKAPSVRDAEGYIRIILQAEMEKAYDKDIPWVVGHESYHYE